MSLYVDIKNKLSGFKLDVKFETGNDKTALLGESGSGKTMTLRCIAGLETPNSGKIILNGRTLFDSEKDINLSSQKRKIGLLFQNYALFPNMTVEKNIGFGLGDLSRNEKAYKIAEKVAMMKLQGLERRYPSQLSGGQQQRVALARALAIEPEALLLDEPFSALDNHLRNHMVIQLVEVLSDYKGVTLFITHNMEEAYKICDNIILLNKGNIQSKGYKEELFNNPPNLLTAQITGCKNISSVKTISQNEIVATDWGKINIKLSNPVNGNISNIGIQSHYINIAEEGQKENVFDCWPSYTSESQFRVTLFMSIGKKPNFLNDYNIQWEICKEKWKKVKTLPLPWKIYINSDKLFLMQ